MSTLVGHFVSSPREREKRDGRRDEREGQGRKRNRNESEKTEEIKTFALYPYLLQGKQTLPNYKPKSVGCPSEARLCWGLTTCQPLWVILCHLPNKGRREIKEMKERERGERGK